MTTSTISPASARPGVGDVYSDRPAPSTIGFDRVVGVELRKMFDTRSGWWLMAAVVILSVLASGAVMLWGSDAGVHYSDFGQAVGIPMAVILPVIAILSVTSEWSQRTGLATFTLVPHRGRVIAAKLVDVVAVGVLGMLVAFAIGALGTVLAGAAHGVTPTWDVGLDQFASIIVGNVLGVLVGFTIGVLLRNSAGALVTYLVYAYVLAGVTFALAAAQTWFADLEPWIDFNLTQGNLFTGFPDTGEAWAQLGVSGLIWLVLPLAFGLVRVGRAEVK
ncbi:ABC transporter permease [Nocardioides acrostichi]|uniref:ABC transporter permease subunit n=1 Tax=Nocardioides acrostichi TaxID=2784339 RepID=A0A930Y9H7_9ACTN|nr:ABC transporter permease [Nocardioides acrostichi]MBF4160373.1 ABC transporter permease subunit [Nocardioides acrostichi]